MRFRSTSCASPSLRLAFLLSVLLALPACEATRERGAERPASPALEHYNRGEYAEALPLLEREAAAAPAGPLLYQIGFCRAALGKAGSDPLVHWGEARRLLEEEVASASGATVERLYYLATISETLKDYDAMRRHARRAVEAFEKGGEPNSLGGEDWFRLARLHDVLEEPSEAEACYRRSASAFRKTPAVNPVYRGLALARVGDLESAQGRLEAAAADYDAALDLLRGSDQVKPFAHGLARFAAGRFEPAIERFEADRDPATVTESQYAADLARKAAAAAPLESADTDGTPFANLSMAALEERIRTAGSDFRAMRDKHSYRQGDPLPAELAHHQRRFVALLRERLVRTRTMQDFCLSEKVADLVRR